MAKQEQEFQQGADPENHLRVFSSPPHISKDDDEYELHRAHCYHYVEQVEVFSAPTSPMDELCAGHSGESERSGGNRGRRGQNTCQCRYNTS